MKYYISTWQFSLTFPLYS